MSPGIVTDEEVQLAYYRQIVLNFHNKSKLNLCRRIFQGFKLFVKHHRNNEKLAHIKWFNRRAGACFYAWSDYTYEVGTGLQRKRWPGPRKYEIRYNQKRIDNFARQRLLLYVFKPLKAFCTLQLKVKKAFRRQGAKFLQRTLYAWKEVSRRSHLLRKDALSNWMEYPALYGHVDGMYTRKMLITSLNEQKHHNNFLLKSLTNQTKSLEECQHFLSAEIKKRQEIEQSVRLIYADSQRYKMLTHHVSQELKRYQALVEAITIINPRQMHHLLKLQPQFEFKPRNIDLSIDIFTSLSNTLTFDRNKDTVKVVDVDKHKYKEESEKEANDDTEKKLAILSNNEINEEINILDTTVKSDDKEKTIDQLTKDMTLATASALNAINERGVSQQTMLASDFLGIGSEFIASRMLVGIIDFLEKGDVSIFSQEDRKDWIKSVFIQSNESPNNSDQNADNTHNSSLLSPKRFVRERGRQITERPMNDLTIVSYLLNSLKVKENASESQLDGNVVSNEDSKVNITSEANTNDKINESEDKPVDTAINNTDYQSSYLSIDNYSSQLDKPLKAILDIEEYKSNMINDLWNNNLNKAVDTILSSNFNWRSAIMAIRSLHPSAGNYSGVGKPLDTDQTHMFSRIIDMKEQM
eukprot:gene21682-28057_t